MVEKGSLVGGVINGGENGAKRVWRLRDVRIEEENIGRRRHQPSWRSDGLRHVTLAASASAWRRVS